MRASEFLKESTKAKHHEVDHHPCMARIVSKSLTSSEYRLILIDLYCWLNHLEKYLARLELESPFQPSRKIQLLGDDIAALSGELPSNRDFSISNSCEHFCLGIHYVVEGSTLGAQFIAPRVENTLGRKDATRFYRAYGDRVSEFWENTRNFLNNALPNEVAMQEAKAGAVFAFDSLLTILDNRLGRTNATKEDELPVMPLGVSSELTQAESTLLRNSDHGAN